jgi:hypothetical protein
VRGNDPRHLMSGDQSNAIDPVTSLLALVFVLKRELSQPTL